MAKDKSNNKNNKDQNKELSTETREIRQDSRNISANMGRRQGPATLSFDFENKPGSEKPEKPAAEPVTEKAAEPAATSGPDGRRTIIKDDANESFEKTKTQYGLPADYRDELYDELNSLAASEAPAPQKSDFSKNFDAFKSKVKKKIAEKQEEAKLARAAAEEKKRQEELEKAAVAAALEEKKAQEEYEAQLEEAIKAEKKAQREAARANIKNKKPARPQKSVKKIGGSAKGAGRIVKPKDEAAKEEAAKTTKKAAAKPVNKPVKKSYSTFKIGSVSRIAKGGKNKKPKTGSSNKSNAGKTTAVAPLLKDKLKKLQKKKKPRKQRKTWVRIVLGCIKLMIACAIVGGVAGGGYVAYTISHADPIHPEQIYNTIDISTHIYNDKGNLTDDVFYSENRDLATYEQFPDNLKNAFISIEDKTFWTHNGFNVRRIFGAIWNSVRGGGEISGTSTITQQLARNVFLPEEKSIRSIKRKIIEMYYAYQIEQELTKEEILTAYLNTIYLGYGCYGVDTAADKYFDEDVENLTLEQCAALAALPPAPGVYALILTENDEAETTTDIGDGLYANDVSQQRRYLVLDLMAEQGFISAEEAEAAKKPLTDFIKPGGATSSTISSFKDYLLDTVKNDLMTTYNLSAEQAEKMVYTKGLNIYSTLDSQAQKAIMKQFRNDDNFPDAIDGSEVEAAMVITEVGTGQIKAMAGTRNPDAEKLFNRAVNPRQPGSSIKPIAVYAPALQKSYEYHKDGKKFQFVDTGYDNQGKKYWGDYITTSSGVVDERMKVKGKVWPQNFSRTYSGYKTFRQAMQLSLNTCAVKILSQVGVDYSMDMVKKFGVTTVVDDASQPTNDLNLAALGLGAMTEGVTPLDMALAYAAFPNGGVVNSGICYTKVTDSKGKILLEGKSEETRVLDEGVAYIMTDMLQTVVTHGIAGEAAISGEQVGGKTGTTDDTWDIWFDGFTANYAAALWIGTDDNVELNTTSTTAARLWSKIMGNVKKAKGGEYKSRPDNVIVKNGEYYIQGTQPPDPPPQPKKTEKKDDKKTDAAQSGGDQKQTDAAKPPN
ncbi:MAG: transglycosylase domain-containing protein [Mogibacterium sp.]|nr:transglycosylase domain-containing protein [Mogibacterium sp.]